MTAEPCRVCERAMSPLSVSEVVRFTDELLWQLSVYEPADSPVKAQTFFAGRVAGRLRARCAGICADCFDFAIYAATPRLEPWGVAIELVTGGDEKIAELRVHIERHRSRTPLPP